MYHFMSRDDHPNDIFSDSGEIEFGKAQGRAKTNLHKWTNGEANSHPQRKASVMIRGLCD